MQRPKEAGDGRRQGDPLSVAGKGLVRLIAWQVARAREWERIAVGGPADQLWDGYRRGQEWRQQDNVVVRHEMRRTNRPDHADVRRLTGAKDFSRLGQAAEAP